MDDGLQTDPLGNTTTYEYDAVGNLLKITSAMEGLPKYTYDERDRNISSDRRSRTTTTFYDRLGR